MEFEKLLESRRSIRAYDASRKVTREQMTALIQAAQQAPSWKNQQTSRYYCILSDEMVDKALDCLPGFNARNAAGAALVVTTFVAGNVGFIDGKPANECGDGWGYYDLGLQNANFLLKARELGLDTLIMGLRDGDGLRRLLDIPDAETVVAVIAVGYAAQPAPFKPRRKAVEDIARFV